MPGGTGGAAGSGGGGTIDGGPEAGTGGSAESGVGGDAADGSAPALRATAIDFYETETQKIEQAVDLGQYDVSVLVYDSAGKTFSTHPPTNRNAGAFEVATLPPGERYVRYSRLGEPPAYYVTTSNVLDLGTGHFGRPDLVKPSAGTELVFNVSNMEAWKDGDYLEMFSLGAGTFLFDVAAGPTGAPNLTDTSLTGLAYDYGGSTLTSLVDGAKGDRAHLIHLSTRTLPGGTTYQATSDVFSMPSFSMIDGQSLSLSGGFTKAPESTLDVDWKASQFDAAASACGTPVTLTSLYFGGSLQPYPEDGPFTASPDVISFSAQDKTDLAATLTFSNPFPARWSLYASGGTRFTKQYALPSTTPGTLTGTVELRILAPGAVVLQPLVGCVRNATVAGQSAVSDVTGAGVTPVIAFDAPATGTSNGYEIIFRRLVNNGGTTTGALAGRIVTTGTTVAVPPGLMAPGNAYVITIRSNARGSIDMNRTPLRFAFPGGVAEFLSGIVRP
jgi:hypothetical protein